MSWAGLFAGFPGRHAGRSGWIPIVCVPLCLLDESDLLGCLFNGSFEVFEIDWLGREVEGSLIHGTTNILHIAVGRYHNAF